MTTPREIEKLARDIVARQDKTDRKVRQLATKADLGNSSFEDGSIEEYSGGKLASIIGQQYDGTHGSVPFISPTPPTPTEAFVEGRAGLMQAGWDGFYVNANGNRDEMIVSPLGFAYVEVHASPEAAGPDFDARTTDTLLGTINSARGGAVTAGKTAGDYWVRLIARTTAGKPSEASTAVLVTIPELVDTSVLEGQLVAARDDIAAAEGRLDLAESDLDLAFGILDAIPSETQAKADAAAAAALQAAKEYAEAVAAGNSGADLEALKADMQAKADAARDAAIAAAAADATQKANAAQAAALIATNGKNKIFRSIAQPTVSFPGTAIGDLWWRYADTTYRVVVGEWTWDGDSWETQKQGHQTIASVDIGALTVVGTATISNVVAQKIAAGTASIQQADIGNLIVTGTSTLADVVAQKIAADTGKFMYLEAAQINVNQIWADLAFSNEARTHLLRVLTNADGTGYKSTVTGQGLRVTFTDTNGTEQDVIKLGTFDQDHLSLFKDGVPSFVATAEGDLATRTGSFSTELTYRGDPLSEILYQFPRGHVSAALRATDSLNNALSGYGEIPYLRLDVELEEGRLYKVWTSQIKVGLSPGATVYLRLRGQSGGVASINSALMTSVDLHQEAESAILQEIWATNPGNPTPGLTKQCSFLISFVVATGGGQAGIRAAAGNPVRLEIEDIGPLQSTGNGTHLNGPPVATPTAPAPTPPPSKSTYTKEYGNSDRYTYDGNGNIYSWPYPRGGQGDSPAGYGNLKSIWTFPSLTAELSGAVVHEVWAYFEFDQWWFNAGGTARIALHGNASRPSTYTGITTGVVVTSGGWPANSGRWLKIPEAHYGGFANGTHKGFALVGDGTRQTYGLARNSKLRIKYTK